MAAAEQLRWAERVRRGDAEAWEEPAPAAMRRSVSGKRLRDDLRALSDPMAPALVGWVEHLTVRRVAAEAEVELARARHERSSNLVLERVTKVSSVEALRGLLHAESPEVARRHLAAWREAQPSIRSARRHLFEIEDEVLARLGVEVPALHGLGDRTLETALVAESRAFLKRTHDLALDELKRRVGGDAHPLAIDRRLAPDATEGWPTRLAPRFVLDVFGRWIDDVRLPAFTVPDAVGGASFARAFAGFGGALRRAFTPRGLPFSLRERPAGDVSVRFGTLFASLLATVPFGVRRLGLARGVADRQARAFAVSFLLHARHRFAKIARAAGDDEDELANDVFGDPSAAPLLDREPGDAVHALALLSTAPLAAELRDRHDEDWFENPRAVVDVRSRCAVPEPPPVVVDGAATTLGKAFERALQ